jgi:sensor histidine kinase YesM
MRINLELLEQSLVTLEKELQNIELYLEFEVLRSEGKLTYSIDVSSEIDSTKLKVPSLVLQPFVENAIWHGILPKETNGHVALVIKRNNQLLHISVVDDGVGLEASRKAKNALLSPKPSRGMSIIHDRFSLLNHRHPGHYFTVQDRKSDDTSPAGVVVEITLPVRYK